MDMRNGINQRRNERLGFKLTEFHSFGEFVYLQGFIYKKMEEYVNGEGKQNSSATSVEEYSRRLGKTLGRGWGPLVS